MSKYFTYLKINIASMYAYRADFLLYMATSVVFFYISVALWSTVYKSSEITTIDTYTLSNTITYLLVTTFLFKLDLSSSLYLSEEIWNGQLTNDLIKPWNVIWVHFIATISDLAIGLLTFAPFFILMTVTSFSLISWPSLTNLLLFFITVALAFLMNFFLNLILHSFTFHFGDQAGQISLTNFAISFLAGGMFPIAFLPGNLKSIFMALPFKFSFFVPAEIYLNKVSLQNVIQYWLQLGVWIVLFYLIFLFVFKSGIKKYSGTGR